MIYCGICGEVNVHVYKFVGYRKIYQSGNENKSKCLLNQQL